MAQANHVTNAIRVPNTAAGRKKSTNSVRTAFREPTAGLAGFSLRKSRSCNLSRKHAERCRLG
jgi:hypothetical protein